MIRRNHKTSYIIWHLFLVGLFTIEFEGKYNFFLRGQLVKLIKILVDKSLK